MPAAGGPRFLPVLALACALAGLAGSPTAQAPPSDGPSLLERVRANLARDEQLDKDYTYRMFRRTYEISAFGKVTTGPEKEFEVGPSPVDPEQLHRRLVAVGGRPLTAAELRREDEKPRAEALKVRARRLRETPQERARRLEKEADEAEESRARLDDAVRVFAFEQLGREVVDGRSVLVISLTPRPEAQTRTRAGRQMKKLRGRAWVDEDAEQLVRIEMDVAADISFGFGLIGHVDAGSRAMYRRAPQPNGTWAPVEARFAGSGATLFFRQFTLETWAKYTDYRPRSASSASAPPAPASREVLVAGRPASADEGNPW